MRKELVKLDFIHESNRIYANDECGCLVAEVTFPACAENAVAIDHTYVNPLLRGQGIASQLMEHAYDEIKGQGKKAYASCSYARAWFTEHTDKTDILLD